MNSENHRKFKLAFPLKFQMQGSDLIISGTYSNQSCVKLDTLKDFVIKSIDEDGFVLFEVKYLESNQISRDAHSHTQIEAGVNGFTLFASSVAKSTAYGTTKSIYEYYKRSRDLSYYALVKRGDRESKVVLGSIDDSESRINQMMRIIFKDIEGRWFDRKILTTFLPSHLHSGRIIKCVLDVLFYENLMVKVDSPSNGRKGRRREMFKITDRFIEVLVNPRSLQKPKG